MTIIAINNGVDNELNKLSKSFVPSFLFYPDLSVSFVMFKKWFMTDHCSIKRKFTHCSISTDPLQLRKIINKEKKKRKQEIKIPRFKKSFRTFF